MPPPTLDLLPSAVRVDEPIAIRLRGIAPGAQVSVRLSNGTAAGIYRSVATFIASEQGDVDLSRDSPVAGSYAGVDAMGLFWSRSLLAKGESADDVDADPMTLSLAAQIAPGVQLAHKLRRYFRDPQVRMREVRDAGLVGRLFEPPDGGRRPAVVVVGGSGGGLQWSAEMAGLLASHGFVAFAVAYFGLEALPSTLDRIPLEYFGRAIDWLVQQPSVHAGRVSVCGVSRGGELALLLGASFPLLKAVVAYVPSGLVWGAYPENGHSAWTRRGEEVPYARGATVEEAARQVAASIAVENIQGPVLMISGRADGLWPATEMSELAVRRLREKGFRHRVEHLAYADAGHAIGWPNVATTLTRFKHPVSGEDIDLGGSPAATARASRDSWPKMLAFLEDGF
ncbi:MAG: hypothetical protein JWP41_315 [Ramlibacter sp.]|nr:hypothetical protein [Ramlibacter sp.]